MDSFIGQGLTQYKNWVRRLAMTGVRLWGRGHSPVANEVGSCYKASASNIVLFTKLVRYLRGPSPGIYYGSTT